MSQTAAILDLPSRISRSSENPDHPKSIKIDQKVIKIKDHGNKSKMLKFNFFNKKRKIKKF